MHESMADLGIDRDVLFPIPRTSLSFPMRLFSRVLITPGCWWWLGTLDGHGYGVLGRGSRGAGNIGAHRAMWELLIGPVPDGMVFDHLCRNPPCVNPEHGEIVTPGENTRRGYSASVLHSLRDTCGEGHPKDGWTKRRTGSAHRYCKTCARRKSLARYYGKKIAHVQ
jgi:hypothetical protein